MPKFFSIFKTLEPQLASLWRWWLMFSNYLPKRSLASFREGRKRREAAKMFQSVRKFLATNNGRHLASALDSYSELRKRWLASGKSEMAPSRLITGWATPGNLTLIRGAAPAVKILKTFRPDVWYLSGGQGGFFNGFRFIASDLQLDAILTALGHEEVGSLLVQPDSDQTAAHQEVRFESVSIVTNETGDSWLSAFYISPREFTLLVEAACDCELATLAIQDLSVQQPMEMNWDVLRSLLVFHLVAGLSPSDESIGNWTLKEIVEPDWIPSDFAVTQDGMPTKVPERYFKVKNLSVVNGGVLTRGSVFLNWDKAQHPSLDFVAGNREFVIGTNANLKYCFVRERESQRSIDCGIVLSSRVDANWFHFLIETLPRLLIVDSLLPKEIPVLFSSRIPKTAVEALKLVTRRDTISLDASATTQVIDAFVPGPVIYHPDTQFLWGDAASANVNISILRRLRNTVLREIAPEGGQDKVFWPRIGRHRVVLNAKKLERLFLKNGFSISNPGEMTFSEQVQSIFGSSTIAAVGGALMSNFIFANPGSRIIVLVSDFGTTYPWPKLLAQVSDAELIMVGGKAPGFRSIETIVEKSHASFLTRTRELRSVLARGRF